jgi:hypothetical protein
MPSELDPAYGNYLPPSQFNETPTQGMKRIEAEMQDRPNTQRGRLAAGAGRSLEGYNARIGAQGPVGGGVMVVADPVTGQPVMVGGQAQAGPLSYQLNKPTFKGAPVSQQIGLGSQPFDADAYFGVSAQQGPGGRTYGANVSRGGEDGGFSAYGGYNPTTKGVNVGGSYQTNFAEGGPVDEPRPLTIRRGKVAEAPEAQDGILRDEDTYGPANIEERRSHLQERLQAEQTATAHYPGDELEAPKGYITPAKAVRWVDTDTGPMAVDAAGNSLPLIQQPGVLPLYRDPTIDSVRVAMPRIADITGDMTGAPLGMTARRVIQAGLKGERPAANMVNIFAGESAKTADLGALEVAKEMAARGADRNDIIQKTGWFQGNDKKWRFEIPDQKAQADVETLLQEGVSKGQPIPFEGVLSHKQFYEAYPELAKNDVRMLRSETPFAVSSGEKYPVFVSFPEGAKNPEARSGFIHEAQHLVQREEGFPTGGNPGMFKYDPASKLTPYEQYKRLAGEVEARNVQSRIDMTPEQRKATHPWETQDVPDIDQITNYAETGAALDAPDLAAKAAEVFGKTRDIREAGYVMPDGSMLDFTGRHQVTKDYTRIGGFNRPVENKRDWMAGERNVDHRDVSELIDAPQGISGTDAMTQFMDQTNAIRNKPGIGFESVETPTDQQLKTLIGGHNKTYRGEPMMVELSDRATGDVIASTEFEKPSVEAVKRWFEDNAPKKAAGGPVHAFADGGPVDLPEQVANVAHDIARIAHKDRLDQRHLAYLLKAASGMNLPPERAMEFAGQIMVGDAAGLMQRFQTYVPSARTFARLNEMMGGKHDFMGKGHMGKEMQRMKGVDALQRTKDALDAAMNSDVVRDRPAMAKALKRLSKGI